MTVKTKDLIERLALKRPQLSAPVAEGYVLDFLRIIRQTLEVGDSVSLDGVGVIRVRLTAPRQGRNLRTGQQVQIPAKWRAKLQLARDLIIIPAI